MDPEIAAHYEQGVERERLTTWGLLEAVRTREMFDRFLPPPPAVVLAVEAIGAGFDLHEALHDPGAREAVLRRIRRLEREPSLMGASPHLMAIGTKAT